MKTYFFPNILVLIAKFFLKFFLNFFVCSNILRFQKTSLQEDSMNDSKLHIELSKK